MVGPLVYKKITLKKYWQPTFTPHYDIFKGWTFAQPQNQQKAKESSFLTTKVHGTHEKGCSVCWAVPEHGTVSPDAGYPSHHPDLPSVVVYSALSWQPASPGHIVKNHSPGPECGVLSYVLPPHADMHCPALVELQPVCFVLWENYCIGLFYVSEHVEH
jgi:hypothetical protein